jgi:hypothetical protein
VLDVMTLPMKFCGIVNWHSCYLLSPSQGLTNLTTAWRTYLYINTLIPKFLGTEMCLHLISNSWTIQGISVCFLKCCTAHKDWLTRKEWDHY